MPVVNLVKPIDAVRIVTDDYGSGGAVVTETGNCSVSAEQHVSASVLEAQKQLYQNACQTLAEVAARLDGLYHDLVCSHQEAIARLSVEIARKVLMRNISDGDYDMESILKEALKNVPESPDTVVHLHPQDLANLQKLQAAEPTPYSQIQMVADAGVGQAECVVENSKGIIKLLIEDRLEQISKALERTG